MQVAVIFRHSCLSVFAWRRVVLHIFDPKQLLRVSCILWCYYPKCYSIILENVSLWSFFNIPFSFQKMCITVSGPFHSRPRVCSFSCCYLCTTSIILIFLNDTLLSTSAYFKKLLPILNLVGMSFLYCSLLHATRNKF